MRKKLLILILILLPIAGYQLWKASIPRILVSHRSIGGGVVDYSGDVLRGLGAFSASRVHMKHWFREVPFVYLAGMVLEGGEGKSIVTGRHSGPIVGQSSIKWLARIGPPSSDPEKFELQVGVKFNFHTGVVTLSNTGAQLPYDPEKVYIAFVDKDLEITDFRAFDANTPPTDIDELLIEAFSKVMNRRHELLEERTANK